MNDQTHLKRALQLVAMIQAEMNGWFRISYPTMKVRMAFCMQANWLAQPHMFSTSLTKDRLFVKIRAADNQNQALEREALPVSMRLEANRTC